MKICISQESISDFVKFFRNQLAVTNTKGLSKDQVYKALYNAALAKSDDPASQSNKDMVLQHMLFLPIALNNKIDSIQKEVAEDLGKTISAMSDTALISNLIKQYQKLVIDTVDYEEEELNPEENFDFDFDFFNAIHYDILTNQNPEYEGVTIKPDASRAFAMSLIRDVIADVLNDNAGHKILAIRLGALEEKAKAGGFNLDKSLVASLSNKASLVFTLVDQNGNVLLKDNKAVIFNTITTGEKEIFEGYKHGDDKVKVPFKTKKLLNMQKGLAENIIRRSKFTKSEEEALIEAKQIMLSQLSTLEEIKKIVKDNPNAGVYLQINQEATNFGYINQNSKTKSQLKTISEIEKFFITSTSVADSNGKVFEFAAITGHTLYNTPVIVKPNYLESDMELVNTLASLLGEPNLNLSDKDRKDLFKKYVNVQSDTIIKFKAKNKISVGTKQYDFGTIELKEALLDHFTSFRLNKKVNSAALKGADIVESINDVTNENQILKTSNGEHYSVVKPKFSFAINPENTIKIEGSDVILKPITSDQHIIQNGYITAELSVDNELRVYHPRIGFTGTMTPVVKNDGIAPSTPVEDFTPPSINDDLFNDDYEEVFALNGIELQTVSDKVEQDSINWFNTSPLSKVLSLNNTNKKHPHALAQWFSSAIVLYEGSNNTLIYHEAWHAFTQGILTKKEKDALYNEVKKNYPGEVFNNEKDIEEFLAEKFRAYAIDKVSPKGTKLQQFFANILNTLKSLVSKKSLTDKYFKDLVEGKIDVSKYNPKENMYWGTLNVNILPKDSSNVTPLNSAESKLILDSMDALVNAKYAELIKDKYFSIKSADQLKPLYEHALKELIRIKEEVNSKLDSLKSIVDKKASDKMKLAEASQELRAITFAIAEFGDISDIENNINLDGTNTGVIGAHISRGSFISETKLLNLKEEEEKNENDPFKERNDLSLEDYADEEILQLLGVVLDYNEKNEPVLNNIGVHLNANKIKVLTKIGKLAASLSNEDLIFKALRESNDPIIKQVFEIMPIDPNTGEQLLSFGSQMLWSKFFKTFNKSNLPLKQLLFERVNNGTSVDVVVKHGTVSGSTTQIERDWSSSFEQSPFVSYDIHGPYLNVAKALEWIDANPNASPASKFNAIGINITDNEAINKILIKGDASKNIPGGLIIDFVNRLRNDLSVDTVDFKHRINNLQDLIKDHLEYQLQADDTYLINNKKGLRGKLNILKDLEFKHSNNYNSFMGTNAEGEVVSEIVLNSSITNMLNEINNAEDLATLLNSPAFEFLNPETNPFIKANNWMAQLFDKNGKRIKSNSGLVKIVNENFSGTKFFEQLVDDKDFINVVERGSSNMSLDENSKFITDVYLSYFNKSEAPRMADKSSSFHYGLQGGKQVFTPENLKDKTLMYNALEGYLVAELVRINTLKDVKGNVDKKYIKRGQDFFIFDALITDELKTKLKENIKSKNYDEVLKQVQKYKNEVAVDVNKYFKEKIINTYNKKLDSFYVPKSMVKTLNVKTKEDAAFILFSMYEQNKFLYNLDLTTMFLGDPALYNVENLDFHKRIAGIISTGEGFRHDKTMLTFFNSAPNKSRAYAASRNNAGKIKLKSAPASYNGSINVGIINDHVVESQYLKELSEALVQVNPNIDPVKEYKKMNEADGQGFISFDYYRMLSISQGIWSDVKETMYRKIVRGESYDQTKVNEFFESMKLQYYGPVKLDQLHGVAFHKFNLIPLIPTMIKGTKLEDLHDKMMEQGIDYVTFESGSKLTTVSNSEKEGNADDFYSKDRTLNSEVEFTKNITHVKYLKNQIKIHSEFKSKVTLPTQMRTILYAGLISGGVPNDTKINYSFEEWESLSESEKLAASDNYKWIVKYENALKDIAEFKRKELFNELGITKDADISKKSEKLSKLVRSELTRSEIDDAQIDFLFEGSTLKTDTSLIITGKQVEKIIVALISKRMTKIKVNGEGLIQMASTMSEKKDSQWKKPTDVERLKYGTNGLRSYHLANGKIQSMEVKIALQGSFEKLLYIDGKDGKSIATYITENKNGQNIKRLDYDTTLAKLNELMADEEWKEKNKSLFIMTTSRIPGQAMNSLEFMTVKEFLPKQAGNIIIVPSEMVAKSGSDFDVDKLFTMMPNIAVYNGKPTTIKFSNKDEDVTELQKELGDKRKLLKSKRDSFFKMLEENSEIYDNVSNIDELKSDIKYLSDLSKSYNWDTSSKTERSEKVKLDAELKFSKSRLNEIFEALNLSKELTKELKEIQDEITNLQIRIDGQSIKGLENNLIDVIVERLEKESNFADLVRPNDTNLVDGLADKLESKVSGFDSYARVHNKDTYANSKKLPKTMIFDPNYNINKQLENSVGMDTLGIGAIINKYYSLFTRIGMYTKQDVGSITYEQYLELEELVAESKAKKLDVPKSVYDLMNSYSSYRLHFKNYNTKIVNGKTVTDLGSLYNKAGEYIPDILGQMINGWVDVAKKGWIFNIQGNKEAAPTLEYLFMAGVSVEDAVYFVSSPIIRNYLDQKRKQNGALAVLTSNPDLNNPKAVEILTKYNDVDAYKAVVESMNLPKKVKSYFAGDNLKSRSQIIKSQIKSLGKIDSAKIIDYVEGSIELTALEELDILNKFMVYEGLSNQITSLTTATTFDTKAESSLGDIRENVSSFENLNKDNPVLPDNIKSLILNNSAIGPFESMNMVNSLFKNFAPLVNNDALVNQAMQGKFDAIEIGIFPDKHVSMYQNDFITYLYQNEHNRINNNVYAGVSLVEDETVDLYEIKDDVLRYNPQFLNGLLTDSGQILGNIRHKFVSRNAALQYITHYALNENATIPKDSMHYKLAKNALRDLVNLSEDTLESKGFSQEEYEDSIEVSAIDSIALLASGNRPSMMTGPFSYASRMLMLSSEYGELVGKFNLLKDIRHNYNKYSENLYLANINQTGMSKIYREDLDILKQFPIPEIQELFSKFDRFAFLQAGFKETGKYNMTSIIDPAHVTNTIGKSYDEILNYLQSLSEGKIKNYSVSSLFNRMYYGENLQKTLWQRTRGGSFESDFYFDVVIENNSKNLSISLMPGVSRLDSIRNDNSTHALIISKENESNEKHSLEYEHLMENNPELLNVETDKGDVVYLSGPENASEELFKPYKEYFDKSLADFNIVGESAFDTMAIEYLESNGYKKHPMISEAGLYYIMSKTNSIPVSGLYTTEKITTIDSKSILNSEFNIDSVKTNIDQLVAYQVANKFGKLNEYNKEKSNSNPKWKEFIKASTANNMHIEAAYRYVVSKIIEKDSNFKKLLINTQSSALMQGDGFNKLNNMYVRALMTERSKLVTIKAIPSRIQQESKPLLTTSSGFAEVGTLKGFSQINGITGAEVYDGQVFDESEADALKAKLDKEFPKVLSQPEQSIANFPSPNATKSIYFGPIPYMYGGLPSPKPAAVFPSWLDKTVRELERRMGVIPGYFDTALINRYVDPKQGLGMHTDAEPNLLGKEKVNPTVLTLSLGAERIFMFKGMGAYANEEVGVKTKHGNVLVMGKDSQFNYKHGIQANTGQKGVRYSITLRHTPDVNPVGRAVENSTGSINTQSSTSVKNFDKKNLFTVTPIQAVDKKAVTKASIATQFIGFGEGITGSSTETYRQQAGKFANTGDYTSKDVIFVSIGGKRGTEVQQKTQQDRTIKEAVKAVEAGATILTDTKSYIDASTYNTGEKRLYANMEAKGYNYSEITVDGQLIGTWSKSAESTNVRTENSYQYYGKPYAIVIENGVGVDVVGYKGKAVDKAKLLAKYNENPNVDPQNGKPFRTKPNPVKVGSTSSNNTQANKYELFPGVFANQGQTEAIDNMVKFLKSDSDEFLLKGRGGTGKTTIIKKIIAESGISQAYMIGATVADEARGVLAENLPKKFKTVTTAALLGLVPDYNKQTGELFFRERNEEEQADFDMLGNSDAIDGKDLIIIDEASMISEDLYNLIMTKKGPRAKVIFMGDNAQIPPINADGSSSDSPVFKLEGQPDNFSELTERMRQGEESPILPVTDVLANNIEAIQQGLPSVNNPLEGNIENDFNESANEGVLYTNKAKDFIDMFVKDYQSSNEIKNAIVIGARNQTVSTFNDTIREKLFNTSDAFVKGDMIRVNSPHLSGKQVVYPNGFKGKVLKVRDLGLHSVLNIPTFEIQVEYQTTNEAGDLIMTSTSMTTINPKDKLAFKSSLNALAVKAKNKQISWRDFYKFKESVVDVGYNYAITAHKVQGSTYKNAYVLEDDIMSFPGGALQVNRMMYTAVSRPTTKLVVLTKLKASEKSNTDKYNNGKLGC